METICEAGNLTRLCIGIHIFVYSAIPGLFIGLLLDCLLLTTQNLLQEISLDMHSVG